MGIKAALASLFCRPSLTPSLEVVRLAVQIQGLPAALDGFTLVHVSDLHVGPGDWRPARAGEAAEIASAQQPDILINTGDFLQGIPPLDAVRAYSEPFVQAPNGSVEGPANLAVLGNHDHYAGDEAVCDLTALLSSLGICVLVNQTVRVRKGGSTISFTGLEERDPDFEETLQSFGRVPRPHVVLLHDAHLAERLPHGSVDLILAGHTHGGQITLPGLTGLIVRRFNGSKYVQGWYRVNDNPLYINRGLGTTGLPVRFRARPEVTVIRFRR